MSDVFREVDEAVREDQIKQLWRRYRIPILAAVVAVVVGVGGWQAWIAWQASERAQASDAYAAALQAARSGHAPEALAALTELSDPTSGEVGTLAAFAAARIELGEGRKDQAIALWDQIAASDAAGRTYRDTALLLSVMHQVETGDAALEARLAPLLVEGQPFRPLALELSALLALQRGETELAKDQLGQVLADPQAPAAQRQRVEQLLAAVGG